MIKKPQAVLFDWDNTLVNTKSAIDIAIEDMFLKMNVDITLFNRDDPINYLSAKDSLPKIFGDKWGQANKIYKDTYKKNQFDNLNLFDGAIEVINMLQKNNIFMAIVSNKLGETLREEINYVGLNSYFYNIVGSTDAKEDKPSKEVVYKALDGSEITPNQNVWFVGDSEVDVLCAIQSGCKPVFYGENNLMNYNNILYVKNYKEFLEILKKFI